MPESTLFRDSRLLAAVFVRKPEPQALASGRGGLNSDDAIPAASAVGSQDYQFSDKNTRIPAATCPNNSY